MESVAADAYLIGAEEREALMDLSQVDWDVVKSMFQGGRKRMQLKSFAPR